MRKSLSVINSEGCVITSVFAHAGKKNNNNKNELQNG
jgi:hypothetical protein